MTITLKTGLKCKKIQVINTYAPHMGYSKTELDKYWTEVKERLKNANKKQCTIWATDNNGQIANDPNEKRTNQEHIGQWTYADKTDKGNGEMLKKCAQKYALSAMNTFFIPMKKKKENLITWQNNEEGHKKQLDYILISHKQQNWVTQIRTKEIANSDGHYQHKLLLMKIRIRLKKEIDENDGIKHIDHDIETLRDNPEELCIKKTDIQNEEYIISQYANTEKIRRSKKRERRI